MALAEESQKKEAEDKVEEDEVKVEEGPPEEEDCFFRPHMTAS